MSDKNTGVPKIEHLEGKHIPVQTTEKYRRDEEGNFLLDENLNLIPTDNYIPHEDIWAATNKIVTLPAKIFKDPE